MSSNGRSVAEWTTFAASCAVVVAVMVLVALQAAKPQDPPAPVATIVGSSQRTDGRFVVNVSVLNEGGGTAANVQVAAELTVQATVTEADQVIDFLARQERFELAFVFDEDPSAGELEVTVVSWVDP